MKYAKAHTTLLYSYSLVVIAISIAMLEWKTPYILEAYRLHWLLLVAVLLLCVLPLGQHKIATTNEEPPRHSLLAWVAHLFGLQTALFFVFIGMALVFSVWLKKDITQDTFIVRNTIETLTKQNGLLPWALYALYASAFAYIAYCKNEEAYASSLVTPLFRQEPMGLLGIALNLQARSAVFITLTITCAFMILLINTLFIPISMQLTNGFCPKTLAIVTPLALLAFTPSFKKIIKKLFRPKIPLVFTLSTSLILCALLIGLLSGLLGNLGENRLPVTGFIQWFQQKDPKTLWIIFSATWWISWTPLIAAHMARLSRGYRIRSMILVTLALPALLNFILFPFLPFLFISKTHVLLTGILAISSFFYLLKIFTEKNQLPMLIRNYLPKADHYKRRDHHFYFRKLLQVMLIIIYLYAPAGITLITYVIFISSLSFTLQIPFALFRLLTRLSRI